MNSREFIKNYRSFLNKNSNQERAVKEKAYLYSDLKHYGVSTWEMDKYFKPNQEELKKLGKDEVLKLVKMLWNSPSHEERSMALKILCLHKYTFICMLT